jgi:hypothetical protein
LLEPLLHSSRELYFSYLLPRIAGVGLGKGKWKRALEAVR